MKHLLIPVLLLSCGLISTPTFAQSATEAFATCLTDSLSGKERKDLASWIFFAMAAHPRIEQYATIPEAARVQQDKEIGTLITRLLAENCPAQLVQAQQENPEALRMAFEMVGKVAMEELMSNNNVSQAIAAYANYVDMAKIQATLSKKGGSL